MTIEITLELILAVVTAVITAFVGWAAKKWHWSTEDYIPFQNLAIGIISAVFICFNRLTNKCNFSIPNRFRSCIWCRWSL